MTPSATDAAAGRPASGGAAVREILPPETGRAWAAMRALRTAWGDRDAFVARVDEVQRPEGYRLAGVFADAGAESADAAAEPADARAAPGDGGDAGTAGDAVAVAGFRIGHNLAWGRFLYVDDLSTLPGARGRGHAGALLEWVLAEARVQRCDEVHLDSGVQPERWDAHRLYLNHGYAITSHHFARRVDA